MSKIEYSFISGDIYHLLNMLLSLENMIVYSRSISNPKKYVSIINKLRQLLEKEIELQGRVED